MIRPRTSHTLLASVLTAAPIAIFAAQAFATPYASNVSVTGNAVSFILNEPSTTLKYNINGGAFLPLDGTAIGTKTFNLGSSADNFSIVAANNDLTGFTIPTGTMIQPTDNGSLAVATNASGLKLISNDTNPLSYYNSPRGVGVSNDPNAANFGTIYVSNSQNAATAGVRDLTTTGDGMFAIHADESDAYGFGNVAQNPMTPVSASDPVSLPAFSSASSNSPYRVMVAPSGDVYVSDFADVNSNAFVLNPGLTTAQDLFTGFNGTSPLPAGQNHGSSAAVYATGSLATSNLVLYTLDEDLTTAQVTGSGSTTDQYSLWKYNIGGGPVPTNVAPTKIANGLNPTATFADFDHGADGKFYLSFLLSTSSGGPLAGPHLEVTSSTGTVLWDSLSASAAIGSSTDIIANLNQIAVSPDQKYLAGMLNYSDVLVIPLINGIPDLTNRLVVDAGDVNSGRDIAFDEADNIYYVSSGQALLRILSPGGNTITTLSRTGGTYAFNLQNDAAGIPGDYNHNGVVDGADYVVWRDGLGTTFVQSDYDVWRSHFGQTSGSGSGVGAGAAVPEPESAVMLLVVGLVAMVTRRRSVA